MRRSHRLGGAAGSQLGGVVTAGASGRGPMRPYRPPQIVTTGDAPQCSTNDVGQQTRSSPGVSNPATSSPVEVRQRRSSATSLFESSPVGSGERKRGRSFSATKLAHGSNVVDEENHVSSAANGVSTSALLVSAAAALGATDENSDAATLARRACARLMERDHLAAEAEEDKRLYEDVGFTQHSGSRLDGSGLLAQRDGSEQQQQQHRAISLGHAHVSYTQLTPAAEAPPAETEPNFYGLPMAAEALYRRRGVKTLYAWQHEVLSREDVKKGKNFVYSLPTSGGKTLVAEVLLARCVLHRSLSAMLVLPFVSIAEEKCTSLQAFGEAFGFPVEGYYGTSGRFPVPKAVGIFVCTMEKTNSLFNHMCEEGREAEIGLVVVDELHMVGEGRRGTILELFLSKVLTASEKRGSKTVRGTDLSTSAGCTSASSAAHGAVAAGAPTTTSDHSAATPLPLTQIVGMSATIPNLAVLGRWLKAATFVCDFRPVPLRQYSVCEGVVLEDGVTNVRNLSTSNDHESVLLLVSEDPDTSTLVFCATRQATVDTAKQIARGLVRTRLWPRRAYADALLAELRHCCHDDSTLHTLSETIPFGVAYHHGGMLMEEREFLERNYRNKRLSILCCTSTLAAGVNLPARRVVFRTPYIARDFLTKSRYLQMAGRAGRAGLDAFGESYLILVRRDREKGHALMRKGIEDSRSAMLVCAAPENTDVPPDATEERPFPRALLESVGTGLVRSVQEAVDFASNMLCYVEQLCDIEKRHSEAAGLGVHTLGALQEGKNFSENFAIMVADAMRELGRLNFLTIESRSNAVATGSAVPNDTSERPRIPGVSDHPLARQSSMAAVPQPSLGLSSSCGGVANARVCATSFGLSAVRSCFSIEEAMIIRDELAILQETGVILSDDLHVCYFLTPIRDIFECDWGCYQRILSRMSDARQRITGLLGVNEYFVHQCAMGMKPSAPVRSPSAASLAAAGAQGSFGGGSGGSIGVAAAAASATYSPILPKLLLADPAKRESFTTGRFYVAMMLCDLLNEVSFADVESKYRVNRGQLQALMKNASMFSSSMTNFCNAMGWYSLEALLSSFVKRLGFGVKPDIVPLMEIKGVQPSRARALWNAGFRDPASIASALPQVLVEKVKSSNAADSKAAKFFSLRSAVALVREATKLIQSRIREKRDELVELTNHQLSGPVLTSSR